MELQDIIITIGSGQFVIGLFTVCSMIVIVTWKFAKEFGKIDGKLGVFDERLKGMETKNSGVASNNSPIKLLEKGDRILNESGLKKFIDDNKENFLNICKSSHNIKTAYDVQIVVFSFFNNLKLEENFEKKLKEVAYKEGLNMDIMRRIGGIYFRDICLNYFKMNTKDIDISK